MVFLCETMCSVPVSNGKGRSLGFEKCMAVPSNGKSGGLALWWKEGVEFSVSSLSLYHIYGIFRIKGTGESWRFTGVYGEAKTDQRHFTWKVMTTLAGQCDLPWLCCGDWNEVTRQEEDLSATLRPEGQMKLFRDCLRECKLEDVHFVGFPLTWNNKKPGTRNVKARLDRVHANPSFLNRYSKTRVEHVWMLRSDHYALLVEIAEEERVRKEMEPSRFQFEAMWLRDQTYMPAVKSAWEECLAVNPHASLDQKLKMLTERIGLWSFANFGSIKKEIRRCRERLSFLDESNMLEGGEAMSLNEKLVELYAREEVMWRQRAKQLWLNEGDKNTRFFHVPQVAEEFYWQDEARGWFHDRRPGGDS